MTIFQEKQLWKREDTLLGVFLICCGFLVNYLSESRAFLNPGPVTPGSDVGTWPDIILPNLAFFLVISGVVLFAIGVKRYVLPGSSQWRFWPAFLVAILLTVPYGASYLATQFIASGNDQLGECPGLVQSVASSGVVTERFVQPPRGLAISCGNYKYGMFLSTFNDISIYGVTSFAAQERVLKVLRAYRRKTYTHPLHVAFYKKENWSPLRLDTAGRPWGGQRGPEDLLRVVTLR